MYVILRVFLRLSVILRIFVNTDFGICDRNVFEIILRGYISTLCSGC